MDDEAVDSTFDVRSTPDVSPADAFEQWEAALSTAYIPVMAAPARSDEFRGRIAMSSWQDVNISMVEATERQIRRTPRLIARQSEQFAYALVPVAGRGWVMQGDSIAEMAGGGMVLLDSSRPFTIDFDRSWQIVVVEAPTDPDPAVDRTCSGTDTHCATTTTGGRSRGRLAFFSRPRCREVRRSERCRRVVRACARPVGVGDPACARPTPARVGRGRGGTATGTELSPSALQRPESHGRTDCPRLHHVA